MKTDSYTITYAIAVGLACAMLLTVWSRFTQDYVEANRRAERVRNILEVLGIEYDAEASADELLAVFEREVSAEEINDFGIYRAAAPVLREGPVAVPFSGSGLWGPIEGFLALEPDMITIRAVSFYRQEETPGLGGEIDSGWFRGRFEGRSIIGPDGRAGIRIVSDREAEHINEVDAITGATMTCNQVEEMINRAIAGIAGEERNNVR